MMKSPNITLRNLGYINVDEKNKQSITSVPLKMMINYMKWYVYGTHMFVIVSSVTRFVTWINYDTNMYK